jgi:hypothetical protein
MRRATTRAVTNCDPVALMIGLGKVLERHVEEQRALDVVHSDGAEQDVDPA